MYTARGIQLLPAIPAQDRPARNSATNASIRPAYPDSASIGKHEYLDANLERSANYNPDQ